MRRLVLVLALAATAAAQTLTPAAVASHPGRWSGDYAAATIAWDGAAGLFVATFALDVVGRWTLGAAITGVALPGERGVSVAPAALSVAARAARVS